MFKIKYTLSSVLRILPPIIYSEDREMKLIIDMSRGIIGYTNHDTEDFYFSCYFEGYGQSKRTLAEAAAQLLNMLFNNELVEITPLPPRRVN